MTVTLSPGEQRRLDVELTPSGLQITELFLSTWLTTSQASADDDVYLALKNNSPTAVVGEARLYDWQEHWRRPAGQDRMWSSRPLNIEPGQTHYIHFDPVTHLVNSQTYIRIEVVSAGTIVLSTPRIYYPPGKSSWLSGNGEGECVYKATGLCVIWYSCYDSLIDYVQFYIDTPPYCSVRPPYQCNHYLTGKWDPSKYTLGQFAPAWFLALLDSRFTAGWEYRVTLRGAYGKGGTTFNFVY